MSLLVTTLKTLEPKKRPGEGSAAYAKPTLKTMDKDIVIYGVTSCREVTYAEAIDFLATHSFNLVIMQ